MEVVGPPLHIASIHANLFEGYHLQNVDYNQKKGKENVFDRNAPPNFGQGLSIVAKTSSSSLPVKSSLL